MLTSVLIKQQMQNFVANKGSKSKEQQDFGTWPTSHRTILQCMLLLKEAKEED